MVKRIFDRQSVRKREITFRLAEAQGWRCCYCGVRMSVGVGSVRRRDNATLEHILPRVHGGGDEIDNLVVVCDICNGRRGTAMWRVHKRVLGLI